MRFFRCQFTFLILNRCIHHLVIVFRTETNSGAGAKRLLWILCL